MASAEFKDLETTIHIVDEKVDRLALGVVESFTSAKDTTQGGFDDLRAFTEFLVERSEGNLKAALKRSEDNLSAHVSKEIGGIRSAVSAIERRFDRLEERLPRKR